MSEEPKYSSKDRTSGSAVLIVLATVSSGLGAFMIHGAFKDSPPELVGIGVGISFICVAVLFLYGLFDQISYKIYDDRIEIFSFTGSLKENFLIADIQSWFETQKAKDGETWKELTVYADATRLFISSRSQDSYEEIKTLLTKDKPIEEKRSLSWFDKHAALSGYLLVSLGVILLFIAVAIFRDCRKPVLSSDLTYITYSIKHRPEWGSGEDGQLYLKWDKYPDLGFAVQKEALLDSPWLFMNSVKFEDTIKIGITTNEYEKKLVKTKPITYADMMINFKFIDVLYLENKNRIYTSLDKYNATVLKGNLLVVPVFAVMLGLLALLQGYLYLRRSKKAAKG